MCVYYLDTRHCGLNFLLEGSETGGIPVKREQCKVSFSETGQHYYVLYLPLCWTDHMSNKQIKKETEARSGYLMVGMLIDCLIE